MLTTKKYRTIVTKCSIILLFLCLSTYKVSAQNVKTEIKDPLYNSWSVNIAPLSLIDFAPRFRIGVEYTHQKNWAISTDIGVGGEAILTETEASPSWFVPLKEGEDYHLYEIRPEFKRILLDRPFHFIYGSIELFYIYMSDVLKNNTYYARNGKEIEYQSAMLTKQKWGAHFKLGIKFKLSKRFVLDLYTGLGFANRTFDYTDVKTKNIMGSNPFSYHTFSYKDEGNTRILHLALGFKLDYVFKYLKDKKSLGDS